MLIVLVVIWLFSPPAAPSLPADFHPRIAVWMGVTWSMDAYDDAALKSLADDLQSQGVDDAFVYVSYLRADGTLNPTYDHAATFTQRMKAYAPEIRLLAWVGVPISVTWEDGTFVENRLADVAVRQQIATFARHTVDTLGFDGVHLNAELIPDGDIAFLQTLDAIREAMPEGAFFSTTAHALRPDRPVTVIPYPTHSHHSSPAYLSQIAQRVDQIALMAYDSGLIFPVDYRTWLAYQVETSAQAVSGTAVELLIGLPTSEEWTPSHQVYVEYLVNALDGFSSGFNASDAAEAITGIALYPYWETDGDEWAIVQQAVHED